MGWQLQSRCHSPQITQLFLMKRRWGEFRRSHLAKYSCAAVGYCEGRKADYDRRNTHLRWRLVDTVLDQNPAPKMRLDVRQIGQLAGTVADSLSLYIELG